MIVDVLLQAATQFVFAIVGLFCSSRSEPTRRWLGSPRSAWALAESCSPASIWRNVAAGNAFFTLAIGRLTGDRKWRVLGTIDSVYQNLATIYAAGPTSLASTVVHMAGWIIGVAEVLIVFACMGHPVSLAEALVIESLLHAIRGAAFAIPGALGAQEGGLVLLCAAFGIPPEQAIALSLVKRAADLVLGVPGLRRLADAGMGTPHAELFPRVAAAATSPSIPAARPLNHDPVLVIGHGIADRRRRLRLSGRGRDPGRPLCARSPAHPRAVSAPAVTVLKPLHGDEPGLLDNLASFCRQDYPGPIQVVFGVQDPERRRHRRRRASAESAAERAISIS